MLESNQPIPEFQLTQIGANMARHGELQQEIYKPGRPTSGDPNAYDVFHAAQEEYNFMAAWIKNTIDGWGPTWADVGAPELDDRIMGWDEWSPFDPQYKEEFRGVPPTAYAEARNETEMRRMVDRWRRSESNKEILDNAGAYGALNIVGSGIGNPLVLVPLYGFAKMQSRALVNMLNGAATAGATEALNEYALNRLGNSRSMEEAATNTLGAAMFSGIVGGLFGRNMKYHEELMEAERKFLDENIDINDPKTWNQHKIIYRDETGKFQSRIKELKEREYIDRIGGDSRFGWIPRTISRLTPIRALSSENPLTRVLAAELGEQTVVGSARGSVETALARAEGPFVEAVVGARTAYLNMVQSGRKMKYRDFQKQVSHAMRNGDLSEIPEVQAAAKGYRKIYSQYLKDAKKYKLLTDEADIVDFADSYFTRVYNIGYMKEEPQIFINKISSHILRENPKMTPQQAVESARIMHRDLTTTHHDPGFHTKYVPRSGPLAGRELAIPDNVLEDFLINEPESVIRQYTRHMSARIELVKRFGDESLDDALTEVDDKWNRMIIEAKDAGASNRKISGMERARDRDKTDLTIMRERLLNRYGIPEDPGSFFVRAGRAARNLNTVRLLGGMTLSALPDLARPLWRYGFNDYMKTMRALITSPDFRNMAKADLRRFGVALDLVLDSRMRAIANLDYNPYGVTRFERGLEKMATGAGRMDSPIPDFGRMSGMTYWNTSMKMLVGVMSQDGLLKKAMQPHKYAKDLKRAGISPEMARRMLDQYKKFGKMDNGLRIGNTADWKDVEAAEMFEMAILKEADSVIVTPGILDRPRFMSHEYGKVIGQIRSFIFAATNRQLLTGMAQADHRVLQGIFASTVMGMFSLAVKGMVAGKTLEEVIGEDGMDDFIYRAAVQSGSIGVGSELAEMAMSATEENASQWSTGNKAIRMAGGPTLGLALDGLGVAYGDMHALRRTIPYNNLAYIRYLMDQIQEKAQEEVDRAKN